MLNLKALLLVAIMFISTSAWAENELTLDVSENSTKTTGSFGKTKSKKDQVFTFTITPQLKNGETVKNIKNRVSGSVTRLHNQDALSFTGIEHKNMIGDFSMITTGDVVKGKSSSSAGNGGSTASSKWAFSGTGEGEIVCINGVIVSSEIRAYHASELTCPVDYYEITCSGNVTSDEFKKKLSEASQNKFQKSGKTIGGRFSTSFGLYQSFSPSMAQLCDKCKLKELLTQHQKTYYDVKMVMTLPRWPSMTQASQSMQDSFRALLDHITLHEEQHKTDFELDILPLLNTRQVNGSCCFSADKKAYCELKERNEKAWKEAIKKITKESTEEKIKALKYRKKLAEELDAQEEPNILDQYFPSP